MAQPVLKMKFITKFPANVEESGFITVAKSGLTYTLGADYTPLFEESATVDTASFIAGQNADGSFYKISVANLVANSQPLNAKLTALGAMSDTPGLVEQTGDDTFDKREIGAGSAASIPTVGDADARYQPLDADLTAIAALASTGLVARSGDGAADVRTITGAAGRVSVANGDGVSGNPTIDWDGVQVRKNSAGSTLTRRRINLIEGSNVTLTVADDAGDDEVDVTIAATVSATLPNGSVINSAYAEYTANADLPTAIPWDDTIPQSTEGTQILSVSLTPSSATSKIRVRAQFWGTANAGTSTALIGALFIDSVANAAASSMSTADAAGSLRHVGLEYEYTPGDTSAHTYKIRVGTGSGTTRLNGSLSSRWLGGSSRATLVVEEIKA